MIDAKHIKYILAIPEVFKERLYTELSEFIYYFREEHPPSPIFLCSRNINIDKTTLKNFINIFSYIHDIPVSVFKYPLTFSFRISGVLKDKNEKLSDFYDSTVAVYNSIFESKINGIIMHSIGRKFQINPKFVNKEIEIELYTMGLRQIDPFLEFLCYYRVIERVSQSNGKQWINQNINRISIHNFGELNIAPDFTKPTENIFEVYKKIALDRIKDIRTNLSIENIGKYLYEEIRCNIAHGKTDNVKTGCEIAELENIYMDTYIIKLLARIAIES